MANSIYDLRRVVRSFGASSSSSSSTSSPGGTVAPFDDSDDYE